MSRYSTDKAKIILQILIMSIELDSKKVYDVLRKKGLENFYHANTFQTSLTFIEANSLLSREYIEKNGLKMTAQKSDVKDKKLGIWDFIFIDGKDFAVYFDRPNEYGPILFILDNVLLLDANNPTVRITKSNPIYWSEEGDQTENYYTSIDDFDKDYLAGDKQKDGGIMFIVTTVNGKLILTKYLKEIIIDDSGITFKDKNGFIVNYSSEILKKYETKLKPIYGTKLKLELRRNWRFRNLYGWQYENRRSKFKELFYPMNGKS